MRHVPGSNLSMVSRKGVAMLPYSDPPTTRKVSPSGVGAARPELRVVGMRGPVKRQKMELINKQMLF